jgi:predicted nucleic acid-binding protein
LNGITLIDTDILIDAGRDIEDAVAMLARIEDQSGLAISATAIHHHIPFISKNQKDYRFIVELDLLTYPS